MNKNKSNSLLFSFSENIFQFNFVFTYVSHTHKRVWIFVLTFHDLFVCVDCSCNFHHVFHDGCAVNVMVCGFQICIRPAEFESRSYTLNTFLHKFSFESFKSISSLPDGLHKKRAWVETNLIERKLWIQNPTTRTWTKMFCLLSKTKAW